MDGTSQEDMERPWMNRVHSFHAIPGESAIVDPLMLTKALVDDAVERGASLLINAVSCFVLDAADNVVSGIQFEDGTTLDVYDGEKVVIAIGPWSSQVEDWFNIPLPIDGVLSTSLTWNDTDCRPSLDSALFCNEDSAGCHLEILPRFDNLSMYLVVEDQPCRVHVYFGLPSSVPDHKNLVCPMLAGPMQHKKV